MTQMHCKCYNMHTCMSEWPLIVKQKKCLLIYVKIACIFFWKSIKYYMNVMLNLKVFEAKKALIKYER